MFLVSALVWWWASRPFGARVAVCVGHAALIWWASSQHGASLGEPNLLHSVVHNSAHVVAFGVLGALILCARGTRPPTWGRCLPAASLALAYGVVDELHQASVPGRSPDPWDIGSDAFGALLGVGLVAYALMSRRVGRLAIGVAVPGAVITVLAASCGA